LISKFTELKKKKKKSTKMTRIENSRSLNQKLLCAAAPGRDERGKREEEGKEKSGREKKESESGDFFSSRFCAFTSLW
jgi:hypothetical protein